VVAVAEVAPTTEQSRARYPDVDSFVERDGVRVHYEVYGTGEPVILLLPAWSITHSRAWKAQIPYLSRHARVITFDPRGNGRSDRPADPEQYAENEFAQDALAVLDAQGVAQACIVGHSMGAQRGLVLAAEHPERVSAAIFIAPAVPVGPQSDRAEAVAKFDTELPEYPGWHKYNRHYWSIDYPDFVAFFMAHVHTEPHSTKQLEDSIAWGLQTDGDTLAASTVAPGPDKAETRRLAAQVRCPALVIHGSGDAIRSVHSGEEFAKLLGAELVILDGAGHAPHARDPVTVNKLIREFACPPDAPMRTTRAGRRALMISSPIGLGHAQRDIAIADELRRLRPGLQIDWLAQHPVTEVLRGRGEHIHPASSFLASECAHVESESSRHDLHAFRAWRRMDEILIANFMVFHDLVLDEEYDLWIGDEAWDLDYYLHENPNEKRAAYAWLTDFVGWLPMPEGGPAEATLTADYNAEMIGHIARYPQLRDRALFVGNPDDIVPDTFGPDLPLIRDWTGEHFDFPGYVTGFDGARLHADVAALRAELGYRPDERVCIATVGGSGVGRALLERVVDAFAPARDRVPDLRMIVVAGPRIDPASLPTAAGLEIRAFVPDLYRHLAACDIAIVQGGLTTAMELAACRTPFLYFPLRRHFEQNFHVRHRLEGYRAGRAMDFDRDGPEQLATALAEELDRPVTTRPVEGDGAARAAALIAELL
jgi:pimeloyl-ACP methyl ester carboxylesterase/predicted glycosyltransferase